MIYVDPNTPGSVVSFKERYENYIGGVRVAGQIIPWIFSLPMAA